MEKKIGDHTQNSGMVSFLKQDQVSSIIKCVLFWLVFMGFLFLGGSFLVPFFRKDWRSLFYGMVGTIAAIITIALFLKNEKQRFRDIWLVFERKSLARFIAGFLVGTIICASMIGVLMLFSDLELHKNNSFTFNGGVVLSYLAFIPLGMMEELAFRSYTFVKLNANYNFRITQLIIAIAFAAYHMIGGQGIMSSLLGPGVWAYVFGLATIRYRGIAMPLGLHIAANVIQAFAGMKEKTDAVLFLDYNVLPSTDAINKTETIGVFLHIMMLIIAVGLTELYVRKKEKVSAF